jgi:hypothetical protein
MEEVVSVMPQREPKVSSNSVDGLFAMVLATLSILRQDNNSS